MVNSKTGNLSPGRLPVFVTQRELIEQEQAVSDVLEPVDAPHVYDSCVG